MSLPPLPEPQKECWIGHELYSPQQMRAYAAAAVAAERELCAAHLDKLRLWHTAIDIRANMHGGVEIESASEIARLHAELAEAISALPQAVRSERERCAKICESLATEETATTCANVAAAIRQGDA